ncbi:hypothetical protein EYZ11_006787 [Aspergillus tanneri]|uniref:Uncharacterized protein n=1 Tax=Aspergillus tanneri TaxID=1220188 RepID=A0A4S3JGW4_9EURO|nr:hypothetical protein EYZ11_006787 [Aspergillus tanneri]
MDLRAKLWKPPS